MTQNEATSLALDTVMVKGITKPFLSITCSSNKKGHKVIFLPKILMIFLFFQEDVTMETVARMSPVKKVFLEVLPNS